AADSLAEECDAMSKSRTPHAGPDVASEKLKAGPEGAAVERDAARQQQQTEEAPRESQARHSAVRRGRLSDLPIKHRLPLLTALLLFGVISAATLLSYLGVRESALELGRERLLSLTNQLAGQLQQPSAIVLGRTSAAANNPAVRAFLKSPSTAARAGA